MQKLIPRNQSLRSLLTLLCPFKTFGNEGLLTTLIFQYFQPSRMPPTPGMSYMDVDLRQIDKLRKAKQSGFYHVYPLPPGIRYER